MKEYLNHNAPHEGSFIASLLDDDRHHIEFNGHLTNHNKHAVIAFYKLRAPEQRIQEFYQQYIVETPYGYGLELPKTSPVDITNQNWKTYIGQRTSFTSYCQFFENIYEQQGLETLLSEYLPDLLSGWVGSLTHALIHLGWALDVNNKRMIVEGFAYLAFSYVAIGGANLTVEHKAEKSPLESFLRVTKELKDNKTEIVKWQSEIIEEQQSEVFKNIHPELMRSGLQYRIAKVLGHSHPVIQTTADWMKKPSDKVWQELYLIVTLVYLSRPGDFLLLHLITSLNAMEKVYNRLEPVFKAKCVEVCWKGILSILFNLEAVIDHDVISSLNSAYKDKYDDINDAEVARNWSECIAEAVADDEEHNAKMVYVMLDQWQKSGGQTLFRDAANAFTETPELPKSFEQPPNYS